MAIALQHHPVRRAARSRDAGNLSHLVRDTYGRIAAAWQRRRAERELEGMPYDLRKDIGFRSFDTNTQ